MVVGQFGSPVDTVLENSPYTVEDLKDGDVIALNDPYMMEGSTSHLPDILLVRPIFYEDDHIGYALQWGNLMDVGGSTAGSILFNDGYADIIKVNIPDGTVLRPKEPAPLSNRLVVMARQFDVLGAVYAKAIGFNVSGSYGTSPNFVYSGVKETGEPFQTMEILYGGIPAIPGKDGLDGHSWCQNSSPSPPSTWRRTTP
jgi:N-methylhydantoinase B/oxoprolinase/acetone carboxylase alpha subunit